MNERDRHVRTARRSQHGRSRQRRLVFRLREVPIAKDGTVPWVYLDQCSQCGYRVISFHSCRNRHCPKCQTNARNKWLAARHVAAAPHQTYMARHDLHAAQTDRSGNTAPFINALERARSKQRDAQEAHHKHLEEHRCGFGVSLTNYGS